MAKRTRKDLREIADAKRHQIQDAYSDLVTATSDASALQLMTLKEVRTLIGSNAVDLSETLIENFQRKRVKQIQYENLQSAADWIKSLIIGTYPQADVNLEHQNCLKIYLEGKPKEIE